MALPSRKFRTDANDHDAGSKRDPAQNHHLLTIDDSELEEAHFATLGTLIDCPTPPDGMTPGTITDEIDKR